MAQNPDVVVVGAGILGLASAYHILQGDRGLDLLVVERLGGPGRGNTARSAAAYRDMFTTPINRHLSQGSISFYEKLQRGGVLLDLKEIGYLWLLRPAQMEGQRAALEAMAGAGVSFKTLDSDHLTRLLPELKTGRRLQGVLGLRCGILNPNRLARFYEGEVLRLGGRLAYGQEVTGFIANDRREITGVRIGGEEIPAGTTIVATGAWLAATMALGGLSVPMAPKKRQLFAVTAPEGPLGRLLHRRGFNLYDLLPLTILPAGAYLRPAAASFIAGYADEDRAPGLEDRPAPEMDFFVERIRPQLAEHFPIFRGVTPSYAWAGHYACHLPDRTPFADRVGGAIVVGGDSGSGIMKGDSLGRVAAGLYFKREQVELGDGAPFPVAAISLKGRPLPPEGWVI